MTGQHIGKLLERFQPRSREHAAQVRIGLFVDGQPSEYPFRILQRLIAHADGSERLCDGDVRLVLQTHDPAVAAHPHAWVAAHAAFDLVEPLRTFRLAQNRGRVERIAVAAARVAADMVFVLDGLDRMPAVEQQSLAFMVGHVWVATP